jgi:hypothetical protein
MRSLHPFVDRLIAAFLMAGSVTLLTAGLLSYAPSAFGDRQTSEPISAGDPLLTPVPAASVGPTPIPIATLPPSGNPLPSRSTLPSSNPRQTSTPGATPTASPSSQALGLASRIRIPSLNIDLPVVPGDLIVPGNEDLYPLCDVAMFMRAFVQPGNAGATYIYAHAQRGMFAPLLKSSEVNDGASMIGALIEVYTSDNRLHLYELYRVKRHATDLSLADPPPGTHMLVLQTSEGPSGTIPKLQVAARPLSVVPADPDEANPRPRPRVCLAS